MHDPYAALKNLNWRYATKRFDPEKKLSEDQLSFLKEVLRLSPSSYGFQPWKFLFVTDPEIRKRLREKSFDQPQVTDAAALVVLCRRDVLDESSVDRLVAATAEASGKDAGELEGFKKMLMGFVKRMPDDRAGDYMANQVHIALGNLLHAAASAQIDACPMGGFIPSAYDEILGLAEKGLRSVVICPVGFRADSDKYATRPKVRFPIEEVVEEL
jgi:nitroreductase